MPERQTLEHLLKTLTPRSLGDDRFEADNTHPDGERLYGGQVLAQSLRAAVATVDDERRVHSQHAYFLRPGDPRVPVTLEVERARDGSSFSSRRVVAMQHGKPILVSSLSFHLDQPGDEFQPSPPAVPEPGQLVSEREREMASGSFEADFQITTGLDIEVRVVEPVNWNDPVSREGRMQAWMKATAAVGDGPGVHESLLAYMSDAMLVDVTLLPAGRSFRSDMQIASLDHALWFHAPCRADEWLLNEVVAERTGGSRGLGRGHFFTREGRLAATCMQESLQRRGG